MFCDVFRYICGSGDEEKINIPDPRVVSGRVDGEGGLLMDCANLSDLCDWGPLPRDIGLSTKEERRVDEDGTRFHAMARLCGEETDGW